MASSPNLVPQLGPDGIVMEPPVIAYTEKMLEEKELEIKKYIEVNYSKIRNVERELSSLAFEIKLTAGPKKAALELLRKKIELSGEKIKVARLKEEQAKKNWEAAAKVLKEEEEKKQILCEDLNRLVQESASIQYSRLEDLKKKLEALNTDAFGQGTHGSQTTQVLPEPFKEPRISKNDDSRSTTVVPEKPVPDESKLVNPQQSITGESRSSTGRVQKAHNSRGRGNLVKGNQKLRANNWTGAGFDVDDHTINA